MPNENTNISHKHKRHTYRHIIKSFDYIQTFYINPEAVSNAASVMITSVDLFFKGKPHRHKNISGCFGPGITLSLCEVNNNEPVIENILPGSVVTIPYDRINTSRNGSIATTCAFDSPIVADSGKYYGLVIKFQDPAFEIWENVQGHRVVDINGTTETPSPGSMRKFHGHCYKHDNIKFYKAHFGKDLKFKVNIANFSGSSNTGSSNSSFIFTNKPYEFLTVSSYNGALVGGEWVYKSVADSTGTLNISSSNTDIVGTGTSFTNNHLGLYALVSNGSVTDVLKITNVANSTYLTVDKYPNFTAAAATYKLPPMARLYYTDYTQNNVILIDSNAANAAFKFSASDVIIGQRSGANATISSVDRYEVDAFIPKFLIGNPATSNFNIRYALTVEANTISATEYDLQLMESNKLPYKGYVLSRSQEVTESGLYGTNKKSAYANIAFDSALSGANNFILPYISNEELDFYIHQYDINSSTTETRYGISDYDTEVERNGTATSKYISKKVSFAENRYAEDVVMYLTAYKPSGTSIKAYVKIHNSADKDAFDDKAWSPLELKSNVDKYSGENPNDMIEYSYGLPQYPEEQFQLAGNFQTTLSNNIVTASVSPSANVASGDLIKLSAPLFPENHEVFVVSSANSTAITLNRRVTNTNIQGEVRVDKLKYKSTAWNNIANDNVARYVTESQVEFDYYNTMQIKLVLLSDYSYIVPRVERVQVIGASS